MTLTAFKKIPVKAYRKCDLRILLFNPGINLKDARAVAEAQPMDAVKFRKLMNENLTGRIPEAEWKEANVLSEDVVRVLLNPEVVEKKNKYSRT